jgi:predicted TIM-barrel fold metal-dependent hydrolase
VRGLGFVAKPERRLPADYRDPTSVLRTMAELYPRKLIWGSDTPFQSYVAKEQGRVLSLRSTYEEEVACLRALPEANQRAIAHDNLLALLRLKNPEILGPAA